MSPGFVDRMIASVLIGAGCSFLYPFLQSGKVNSIGLTVVMISIFMIGCFIGELSSAVKNSNNKDKKKM